VISSITFVINSKPWFSQAMNQSLRVVPTVLKKVIFIQTKSIHFQEKPK